MTERSSTGAALPGTAFATLLLIAFMMGANHVAARLAFDHDRHGTRAAPALIQGA